MKNLQLIRMILVSNKEKKARKILFDPKITVIQGKNDTGKSSVIKSIVTTLGAPAKFNDKWVAAEVSSLIDFKIDDNTYAMYHFKGSYSLFSQKNDHFELINTYTKIGDLSPKMAELLGFSLKLPDKNTHELVIPPPAFFFLPFYQDQDKGWTDTWRSVGNLGQFDKAKQHLAEYHFGMKPEKWYEEYSKKAKFDAEQKALQPELDSIIAIEKRTHKRLSQIDFNIDVEQFQKEIDALLVKLNALKVEEQSYRDQVVQLTNEEIRLKAQLEIASEAYQALDKDCNYALNELPHVVTCPTCHAQYDNDLPNRFELRVNASSANNMVQSLTDALVKNTAKLSKERQETKKMLAARQEVEGLLTRKKGKLNLKDVLEIEGKKMFLAQLETERQSVEDKIKQTDKQLKNALEEMDKLNNKVTRKTIRDQYATDLRSYTFDLNASGLNASAYKRVDATLQESGSDLSRAILAYVFATQNAIRRKKNTTLVPLILDAPNQQEQDDSNLETILKFIYKHRYSSQQLIVGLVSDGGVKCDGKVESFTKKYSALNEDDYDELALDIRPFQKANLGLD